MADSIFLKSALAYARMGWPVFPLAPGTKDQPLTRHGSHDATTDEVQIRRWWGPQPRANIALATLRFFALDSDELNGGYESLEKLEREHGKLPDTIQQMSGSGHSRHWLFQMPDFEVRNSASKIAPGLDIRGIGGYLVAAPSIHPNTGKPYVWDGLDPLEKQALLPAPAWLLEKLRARPEPAPAPNGQPRGVLPEKIRKGQQNDVLFRRGCAMRGQGFEEAEIFAALSEVNKLRCEEPGTEEYVRELAAQICHDYAAGDNLGLKRAREETRPPKRIPGKSRPVNELRGMDVRMPGQMIEEILTTPGLSLMNATQKAGKTVLAVQMLMSVANGIHLFDNYRVQQGPTLLFEFDDLQGKAELKQYELKARASREGMPFYYKTIEEGEDSLELSDAEFLPYLRGEITEKKAQLVVLDSYSAMRGVRGKSADVVKLDSEDMFSLQRLALELNCAFLLLHHDSKSSSHLDWASRGAGSYAIAAAADAIIYLTRYPELAENEGSRLVSVRSRRMRGAEFTVRYREESKDFDLVITGPASREYPDLKKLNQAFQTVAFTAQEAKEAMGLSQATAYRFLAKLVGWGVLRKESTAFTWDPNFDRKYL